MKKLGDFRVLLVAESSSVMLQKSFKSGLYPELFKVFHTLFGKTKICFCNEIKVFDYQKISDFEQTLSLEAELKKNKIEKLLYLTEILVGRNLYIEKFRYRHLLKDIQSEFDLVISITSTAHSGVLACLISRMLGIPFIILEHKSHYQRNLVRFWHKRLIKYVQLSAEIVTTGSDTFEKVLQNFNPGIKTGVVPNPIGSEMFENTTSDLILRLKDFTNDIFCFGAWQTWRKMKRLDLLLNAFDKLRSKSKYPCKLIIGGSSVNDELKFKMKKDPDILFLGSLSRKDVHALSSFVNCGVVVSQHETAGLPIVEGWAQGTPVISTKAGGVEDLVDHSLGIVIERDDLHSLVNAMELIIQRKDFSRNKIKEFAKDKFGFESVKNKWSKLLSNCLLDK